MDEMLDDWSDNNNVYILSITHARFTNHFESFIKYAKESVLWIEEVHEFLAVGDAGVLAYGYGTGFPSKYAAKCAERFKRWMKVNGRILAFTATPTLHQSEYDQYILDHKGNSTGEKFSNLFHKSNDLWNDEINMSTDEQVDMADFFYELCPETMYEIEKEIVEDHENT